MDSKDGNFQPTRSGDDPEEDQVIEALAVEEIEDHDGIGEGEDTYVAYKGNGTVEAGWPDVDDWVSFEDMYDFPFPRLREVSRIKANCSI